MTEVLHKRLVNLNFGQKLELQQRPQPKPGRNEVIVKTEFAGICHTDVHLWKDELPYFSRRLPAVYGHEIGGRVYSLGPDANKGRKSPLKVGDRVVVYPWGGCQNCNLCKAEPQHCPNLTAPKVYFYGVHIDGGFQNFVSVPTPQLLHRVPDGVPMDLACLIPCSGLTAYNAVSSVRPALDKAIKYDGEARVMIVGLGGLGVWALRILRGLYPGKQLKVFCTATRPEKIEIAKKQGVYDAVLFDRGATEEELVKRTKEVAGGALHAAIDFVGLPATTKTVIECCGIASIIANAGIMGDDPLKLPQNTFTISAKRFVGILTGTPDQMDELIDLVNQGKVKPVPITHVHLEDVSQAFQNISSGKVTGRLAVKF